ncbi:hypothetical protein V2J73_02920 [Pseudomonas alliivorans]|nr:hypothetical protein [Pseudomonas alliivorans]
MEKSLKHLACRVLWDDNQQGQKMARSTRTDYAKVKIWMTNMTSEVEGSIAGIAIEVFAAIDGREKREKVLKMMQERHEKVSKHEQARQSA